MRLGYFKKQRVEQKCYSVHLAILVCYSQHTTSGGVLATGLSINRIAHCIVTGWNCVCCCCGCPSLSVVVVAHGGRSVTTGIASP